MENMLVELTLVPFNTDPNSYYVKVKSDGELVIVAMLIKNDDGTYRPVGGDESYASLAMAAFADASLADPALWTE
jgi:hypothetical protein